MLKLVQKPEKEAGFVPPEHEIVSEFQYEGFACPRVWTSEMNQEFPLGCVETAGA